jgi:hypothetical protein
MSSASKGNALLIGGATEPKHAIACGIGFEGIFKGALSSVTSALGVLQQQAQGRRNRGEGVNGRSSLGLSIDVVEEPLTAAQARNLGSLDTTDQSSDRSTTDGMFA